MHHNNYTIVELGFQTVQTLSELSMKWTSHSYSSLLNTSSPKTNSCPVSKVQLLAQHTSTVLYIIRCCPRLAGPTGSAQHKVTPGEGQNWGLASSPGANISLRMTRECLPNWPQWSTCLSTIPPYVPTMLTHAPTHTIHTVLYVHNYAFIAKKELACWSDESPAAFGYWTLPQAQVYNTR